MRIVVRESVYRSAVKALRLLGFVERCGLKSWIEVAKTRLHHNVLAIALANKLARIAWAVLNKGRAFACVKTDAMASRPA